MGVRSCISSTMESMTFTRVISVIFLFYIMMGVLAFCSIFEKWTIVDCLYFSIVTFTTVGYGDVTPQSDAGKIMACFFTCAGHAFIGIIIGYIGHEIYRKKIENLKNDESKALNDKIFPDSMHMDNSQSSFGVDSEETPERDTYLQSLSRRVNVTRFVASFEASMEASLGEISDRISEGSRCSLLMRIIMLISLLLGPPIIVVIVGAVIVGHLEKWSREDSF